MNRPRNRDSSSQLFASKILQGAWGLRFCIQLEGLPLQDRNRDLRREGPPRISPLLHRGSWPRGWCGILREENPICLPSMETTWKDKKKIFPQKLLLILSLEPWPRKLKRRDFIIEAALSKTAIQTFLYLSQKSTSLSATQSWRGIPNLLLSACWQMSKKRHSFSLTQC